MDISAAAVAVTPRLLLLRQQPADVEQQADEVQLRRLLGVACLGGVGRPVAVVDVLAPFFIVIIIIIIFINNVVCVLSK